MPTGKVGMERNEDVGGSALEGNESSDSNEGNLPQAPGLHRKYSAIKGITGPRMCLLADAVPLSPVHSANVDPAPLLRSRSIYLLLLNC